MAKRIAFSVAGVGTELFGRRDYRNDGSWITTKWFVIGYIPIKPERSYRVLRLGEGYEVLWEGPPVLKQVISLYLYCYGPLVALFALVSLLKQSVGQQRLDAITGLLGDTPFHSPLLPPYLGIFLALYLVLPLILRSRARWLVGISLVQEAFLKIHEGFREFQKWIERFHT